MSKFVGHKAAFGGIFTALNAYTRNEERSSKRTGIKIRAEISEVDNRDVLQWVNGLTNCGISMWSNTT